jgi:hypothetical protein
MDKRIDINKFGKFYCYNCSELDGNTVWRFLNELEFNRIYTFIPFISVNSRPDEPYIILSQQILVSSNSWK